MVVSDPTWWLYLILPLAEWSAQLKRWDFISFQGKAFQGWAKALQEMKKRRGRVGDFLKIKAFGEGLWKWGELDAIWSLSAIEHFGLGVYAKSGMDNVRDADYDIEAMMKIGDMLKPGGHAYITVPYGKQFFVCDGHWRSYCRESIKERIVQDFRVLERSFFLSAGAAGIGEPPMEVAGDVADSYDCAGHAPHVTVFLKLEKP